MRFCLLQHNWALNKALVAQVSLSSLMCKRNSDAKVFCCIQFLYKFFVIKLELFNGTCLEVVVLLHDPQIIAVRFCYFEIN